MPSPQTVPYLRIFLSSPGDVTQERLLAREAIQRLPNHPSFRERVAFNVIAWDEPGADTPMRATMSPQEAINAGLPRPSECDLVVVIFWGRMGTPFTLDDEEFLSGTHWELLDAIHAKRPEVLIYKCTADPGIKANDPERDAKYAQYDRVEAFFQSDLFIDPANGQILRGVNQYATPEEFRTRFETHLADRVLAYLSRYEASPDPAPPPATSPPGDLPDSITTVQTDHWQGSPFPGLKAFMPAQAPIFFGRGAETDDLVARMAESRFVAVIGASGSGKSSLVGAGLLPRLANDAILGEQTASRAWKIVDFTPTRGAGVNVENPFEALYHALIATFPKLEPNALEARRIKLNFLSDMLEAPATLCDICQSALDGGAQWAEALLFIDQFEELFTLGQAAYVKPFAAMLEAVAASDKLRAVITMRADFYHRCLDVPALAKLLQAGSFPLSAPSSGALYEMIARPAEMAALEFEGELAAQILADTGEEPGSLALMAYALDELYKIADARRLGTRHASSLQPKSLQITHADYQSIGGVPGAIGKRAEGVFGRLEGTEEDKTALLQSIFHELVEVDERGVATRRRAIIDPAALDEEAREMVAAFTDARLLTTNRLDGGVAVTLEVAHEAILRNWKRLADWIEATQDERRLIRSMEREARWWDERGRPDHMMPNTAKINEFQDACAKLNVDYDPDSAEDRLVLDFIEPEQKRLWRELHDINTPHARRSVIGETLHNLGDDRFGIGVREDGTPEIDWSPVPGGQIEIEGKHFTVAPFYIARYLVTYPQFEAFLQAEDGFGRDEWWADLAYGGKQSMNNQRQKFDNYPRDSVSWYQAVAFTRWLNARLRGVTFPHPDDESQPPLVIGNNVEVRLPAEWEWQHAATGGDSGQMYPWGSEFDARCVNGSEGGIGRTSAVGVFPHGAADCGALDMAGNLWEWCLNDSDNLRIDFTSEGWKRMMGGAYYSDGAGASSRSDGPYYGGDLSGLRVAVGVRLPSQ